jgi:hypothetical protein
MVRPSSEAKLAPFRQRQSTLASDIWPEDQSLLRTRSVSRVMAAEGPPSKTTARRPR